MIGLDTTFFLIELVSGIYSGSLALMADAFHMVRGLLGGGAYVQ
jgi:Co/Zn/Cd efflux system component